MTIEQACAEYIAMWRQFIEADSPDPRWLGEVAQNLQKLGTLLELEGVLLEKLVKLGLESEEK